RWAVELRREESRRRLQDLVGPPQLSVLPPKLLELLDLIGGRTRPATIVAFGLPDPVADRLRRTADLVGHRTDRCPLRVVLRSVANTSLTERSRTSTGYGVVLS